MNNKVKQIILYTTLIIVGLTVFFYGIIKAKGFFIPFTLAVILSMVLLPVEAKLRSWKITKGISVFLADFFLFLVSIGLLFVIGLQIQNISDNWPQYKEKLQPKVEKVQNFIEEKTGISEQKQDEKVNDILKSDSGESKKTSGTTGILMKSVTFSGNFLLVFVYIFFFMYYKDKFKKSILKFFPENKRDQASLVLHKFSRVSQQYLFGRFIIIIFLAVVYGIGLAIIGIKYAILVAILAAVLTIIPYIGNIIGVAIAISMSLLTDGAMGEIIGILLLFGFTQFFESYFLEPYVVGHQVNLNPVVSILVVVIGGIVWGIAGMIIAMPLLGILKAIFDHVPVLNPMGYMLDETDTGESWMYRMKDRIVRKIKK